MKTEIDIFYGGGRPMESMAVEDADPEVHHRSVEVMRDLKRAYCRKHGVELGMLIVHTHGGTEADSNALRQAPSAKRQAA